MMMGAGLAVVTGGGGFIGGWLADRLLKYGYDVRCIDRKPVSTWFQIHPSAENIVLDLRDPSACHAAVYGARHVYNLASNMGGMGFIETNKAACMLSVLINTQMLVAARKAKVERYFFSSSACVYTADKQATSDVLPLKEEDAYPAMPEDGYGWEKLFSERLCRHFREDFGLQTVCARYHNVYGPFSSWDDGREKAPAAICRKVIEAKLSGDHRIEIWGDGQQTLSFTYIDDCITGTVNLVARDIDTPVNLGSAELVTINQLVDCAETIAGIRLERHYNLGAPQGVRGRNSDNTLIRRLLSWEPTTTLSIGMERTYRWIEREITRKKGTASAVGEICEANESKINDRTPATI
jgi:GDP-D-mannose 3', 5'-epimerase